MLHVYGHYTETNNNDDVDGDDDDDHCEDSDDDHDCHIDGSVQRSVILSARSTMN